MTIVEEVKAQLRISHSSLDELLAATVDEAKAELIRLGVSTEKVADADDHDIRAAIKLYALRDHGDSADSERYDAAYKFKVDCIRKDG